MKCKSQVIIKKGVMLVNRALNEILDIEHGFIRSRVVLVHIPMIEKSFSGDLS